MTLHVTFKIENVTQKFKKKITVVNDLTEVIVIMMFLY